MNPAQKQFFLKRAASKIPISSLLGIAALTGCTSIGVEQQRLVSKPNMEFGRSAVSSYSSKIMPQVLPGLAGMPGGAATTCTACR